MRTNRFGTRLITTAEYCPGIKVPQSMTDLLLRQVQIEDEINHSGRMAADIPKFEVKRIPWTKAAWHAFGREITSFMRP